MVIADRRLRDPLAFFRQRHKTLLTLMTVWTDVSEADVVKRHAAVVHHIGPARSQVACNAPFKSSRRRAQGRNVLGLSSCSPFCDRASPVPAPPPDVGGGSITLAVPIRFSR